MGQGFERSAQQPGSLSSADTLEGGCHALDDADNSVYVSARMLKSGASGRRGTNITG